VFPAILRDRTTKIHMFDTMSSSSAFTNVFLVFAWAVLPVAFGLSADLSVLPANLASLAAVSSEITTDRSLDSASATSNTETSRPKEASWFAAFDKEESTYSVSGVSKEKAVGKVGSSNPLHQPVDLKQPKWFIESPSGGPEEAWQSYYPELNGGRLEDRNVISGAYDNTLGRVMDHKKGGKPPVWFESSVNTHDAYGRKPVPSDNDPRSLTAAAGWEERSVNETIACEEAECTAKTTLYAFDPATEEAEFCKMSVGLHATDFDGAFALEGVKNWMVNGYLLTSVCEPMAAASTCNEKTQAPLYGCVSDVPVDLMVKDTGVLNVSGSLTKMVDECPYEGNLLSGVVFMTCMVRTIPTTTTTTQLKVFQLRQPIVVTAPLQCAEPGCLAKALVSVDPTYAMYGGSCFMNISIIQTDFDAAVKPETVEFIHLLGPGNLVANATPGANPCISESQGEPLTAAEKKFSLVENENVTAELLALPAGQLILQGKISEYVDECPSADGFLLDGLITVRCDPPVNVSFDTEEPHQVEMALVQTPLAVYGPAAQAFEFTRRPGSWKWQHDV